MSVVLFGACGGESGLSADGPGSEAGEAGQGSSPKPPGDGGAGGDASSTGGMGGDSSPSTGGTPSKGGTGGTGTGTGGVVGKGGAPAAGGRSMAGAPSTGGSKSMPEAGQPNIPDPPEPPDGCQPQSISSSLNDCSIQLLCGGNQWVAAYCGNPGTGGPWNCQCEGSNKSYQQYTISGVTGGAACSSIAAFCASGEVPDPGPEECSDVGSSRQANYCTINETCIRPFEIADGIEAGLAKTAYASCSNNGSTQQCSCQPDQFTNPIQIQISGQDGTTACDTAMDVCKGGEIEGEFVCTQQSANAGAGYCDSQMQCNKTAEVEDGVFATIQDYRVVSCSSSTVSGQGRSACNCSSLNTGRYTRFDVDIAADGALCSRVTEACDTSAIELSGPITCAPASQNASGGYCSAQIDCKQAGTVGDLELDVYGSLSTDCQQIDGEWTCNCYTGRESAQVVVEADSEWDACSAAVVKCPDVVEVKIGESNGGIFPPGVPIPF